MSLFIFKIPPVNLLSDNGFTNVFRSVNVEINLIQQQVKNYNFTTYKNYLKADIQKQVKKQYFKMLFG